MVQEMKSAFESRVDGEVSDCRCYEGRVGFRGLSERSRECEKVGVQCLERMICFRAGHDVKVELLRKED